MISHNDQRLSLLIAEEEQTRSEAYRAHQEAVSSDSTATELHLCDAMRRYRAAVHAVLDRQKGREQI
jgi:hypothetical protein